jgi:glyoxylase-like metal-dependent hydrolase (beta-lactamase superfamily II)
MWQQLGEGVFRRRYESLDLNVGAVLGAEGVLLIDTRASHRQAAELQDELRRITKLPVRWVLNTHYHWDHCWGNAVFKDAQIWGHELCRSALLSRGEQARRRILETVAEDDYDDVLDVVITPPEHTFGLQFALDIGGRVVEFRHLGRGHTDSDVVAIVADAGVMFAGDLLEEGAPPAFDDAYPLEWPATLDALTGLVGGPVVPGHGDVVGREFIETQSAEIAAVAALSRASFANGLSPDEVDFRMWPVPEPVARVALQRAFLQMGDD